MASSHAAALPTVLAIACLLIAVPRMVTSVITCGQVVSYLSPCIPYAQHGGPIPVGCCDGVKGLNAATPSTPDRQAACNCIKNAASGIPGLNPGLVVGIPGKCGVTIPYPISTTIDCSKVK